MTAPFISVIVPVYNAEKTLLQCANSILEQECTDIELLLIDDGSADGSSDLCDEIAGRDDRVRVFHKENGGVSSARNVGLENAVGTWVTFVDSDDMVSSDYFNGIKGKEEDLLIKGYAELHPKTGKIGRMFIPDKEELPNLSSYLAQTIDSFVMRSPCCKFYRYSLLKEMRFHEDMKVGEDACFVMDYLCGVNSIRVLTIGFYIVRWHYAPVAVRYKLSMEEANTHLRHLFHAYQVLNEKYSIGRVKFYSFMGFYKAASIDAWKKYPRKWYLDKNVHNMYKYVWPDLSLKQKLRLLGAFILRR